MNVETLSRGVKGALSNLWGRIEDRRDSKKSPKYKNWSSNVEKKVTSVTTHLKNLEAIDVIKKEKQAQASAKIISCITELNALLSITTFKYDLTSSNGPVNTAALQDNNRTLLLNLWALLLGALGRMDAELTAASQETILAIMQRPELEAEQLAGAPPDVAVRHREMLYTTLDAVSPRTCESSGQAFVFASKVIAIIYWLLPQVGDAITEAVGKDVADADHSLLSGLIHCEKQDHPLDCPTLLAWRDYHKTLPTDPYPQTFPWIANIARRELAWVAFLKEWVAHVKAVLRPSLTEWSSVPGFCTFISSAIYDIRTKDQPPAPLTRPYPLLELQYILLEATQGELINAYIKASFLRTSAYDVLLVMNTLSLVEAWFLELQRKRVFPASFDMDFFCKGLSILLDSDHHQVVLRVLQIIYNSADLFDGPFRKTLFDDLLLQRMFFSLFLHWDPGVRNAFQQVLIFKMVRIRRSVLSGNGIVVKEMSKIEPTPPLHPHPHPHPDDASQVTSAADSKRPPSPSSTTSSTDDSQKQTPHQSTPRPALNSSSDTVNSTAQPSTPSPDSPTLTPTSPLPEMNMDIHLFLRLNAYVQLVEDQMRASGEGVKAGARGAGGHKFPPMLEVYAPAALAGFNQHLARYHQWELKEEAEVPRLAPLPFVRME